MRYKNRVLGFGLSLVMAAGLICPTVSAMAENPSEETGSPVELGDLLQLSVNGGEKSLMGLYENGMYEGKTYFDAGQNTYQIYRNDTLLKEGVIDVSSGEDIWVRYQADQDKIITSYENPDEYNSPATWVGNFSAISNESGDKYFWFDDWAPSDSNANLDYIGGGCYQKKFTCEALEADKTMEYKIAFGGDWNHGAVPGDNKNLTLPEGTTEITLWVNTATKETFDSVTDGNATVKLEGDEDYTRPVGTMNMEITVDGTGYPLTQISKNLYIGTVSAAEGEHSWQNSIDGQQGALSGTFTLEKKAAVTFLYDSEKNTVLNSESDRNELADLIGCTSLLGGDDGDDEDDTEEVVTGISANLGDLLQISVNGGDKSLMSPYTNGLYEGNVSLKKGKNTYRIYLNEELFQKGTIEADAAEEIAVRYLSFQDKVITKYDGADVYKYPATWVGSFSDMARADGTKYISLSDWAPGDTNGNLDYIGGGCYKKTFTYEALTDEKSMEYKIAFGGDWNHGSVPGSNKSLSFPAGSSEITLWVNTITEETFDSITDGNVTAKLAGGADYVRPAGTMEMKLVVDGEDTVMIQTGKTAYMKTVLLGAGEHSWKNMIDGQEGMLSGSFTLKEDTAVTFWYDAEKNVTFNSVENADGLASALDWSKPVSPEEYDTYDGNDLGAVYSPEGTTFKVWAPSASEVSLRRYTKGSSSEDGDEMIEEIPMEKDTADDGTWDNGVWKVTVKGDLINTYYTYLVTVGSSTKETNDVYAKAVGFNGQRAMVVNLAETDPEGWSEDDHVTVEQPTDAVVWEVNVRDFSSDSSSGMENKGKYLAFTETGTTLNGEGELSTGIDYLNELGVNYVQLLPSFDYVNDEADESNEGYDWGYSPLNYNVPEGLYSTNPYDGNARIHEFKQMVQSLHDNNIGVVMDVVFNHVGGDARESWLNRTVPGYYFRQDEWGHFLDSGTACGNETASENEMFRKYMIDSVVYWATEYHIDGFRFDLMGCHDIETMNAIREALDELPGGEKILMYGEPWTAGSTNEPEGVEMVSQATMKDLDPRIGAFNDFIRDSLKGRVFDDNSTGFVQAGNYTDQPETCPVYTDEDTMAALQGNTNPAYPDNWAAAPSQVVSYASAHDDLGLYDKLQYSVNGVTEEGDERYYERDENLVKMNKMAAAAIMTSQGSVFFQAGEEMARSKGGVANSYNSPLYFDNGNELNAINWNRSTTFSDLFSYYQGLLELRKAYAPFRASDMTTVNKMTFSDDETGNLVGYTISSPGEKWDTVAVLMNSNTTEQKITLKAQEGTELPDVWDCVVNQTDAGVKALEQYEGNVITVPAQTVLVLVSADNSDTPDDPDDNNKPDDNKPGNDKPDNSKPDNNNSDGNKPGNSKPDNNNSDGNKLDNNKPDNSQSEVPSGGKTNTISPDKTNTAVKNDGAVKTGDTSNPVLPVMMCAAAAAALGIAVSRKKKLSK